MDKPKPEPDNSKRHQFEEIMRKYFPPDKYPQFWIDIPKAK